MRNAEESAPLHSFPECPVKYPLHDGGTGRAPDEHWRSEDTVPDGQAHVPERISHAAWRRIAQKSARATGRGLLVAADPPSEESRRPLKPRRSFTARSAGVGSASPSATKPVRQPRHPPLAEGLELKTVQPPPSPTRGCRSSHRSARSGSSMPRADGVAPSVRDARPADTADPFRTHRGLPRTGSRSVRWPGAETLGGDEDLRTAANATESSQSLTISGTTAQRRPARERCKAWCRCWAFSARPDGCTVHDRKRHGGAASLIRDARPADTAGPPGMHCRLRNTWQY